MWVISNQVLHLRNPYTDFSVDFDKRMVKEGVPLEVPDDDFIGAHLGNRDNGRPLRVMRDDEAKKKSAAFWKKLEAEAKAAKEQRDALLNEGSMVSYLKSQETHVPKVLGPAPLPKEEPEPETDKKAG